MPPCSCRRFPCCNTEKEHWLFLLIALISLYTCVYQLKNYFLSSNCYLDILTAAALSSEGGCPLVVGKDVLWIKMKMPYRSWNTAQAQKKLWALIVTKIELIMTYAGEHSRDVKETGWRECLQWQKTRLSDPARLLPSYMQRKVLPRRWVIAPTIKGRLEVIWPQKDSSSEHLVLCIAGPALHQALDVSIQAFLNTVCHYLLIRNTSTTLHA